MAERGTQLFRLPTYAEGIQALSAAIVADNAATKVHLRTISAVSFTCQWCTNVVYSLVLDPETEEWVGIRTGEHTMDERHVPKPLKEHIGMAIAMGMGDGFKGKKLAAFVRRKVRVDIPKSTISSYVNRAPEQDWRVLWRQIPFMGRRFVEAGLKYQDYRVRQEGKIVLDAFAVTLPSIEFAKSSAFLGIVFVDGAHMGDKMKSTMLAMVTVTSDHIILPLAVLIGPSEDKTNYVRLLEFTKPFLPTDLVIMSDQSPAMESAFAQVFRGSQVRHLPCFFHILKGKRKNVSWEVRQILTADNQKLYDSLIDTFKKTRESLYLVIKDHLGALSFMSGTYAGKFEYIADSPIESFNAAIKNSRLDVEPLNLIKTVLAFSETQYDRQVSNLALGARYCPSCDRTIRCRMQTANTIAVREDNKSFIATEVCPTGLQVDYTLQCNDAILTCTCKGYERLAIPCRHMFAVAARYNNIELPAIGEVHESSVIRKGLGAKKTVLLGDLQEEEVEVRKPRRKQGRPRLERFKPFSEHLARQTTCKCSACGQQGHTKRSKKCPLNQPERPQRQRRSRSAVTSLTRVPPNPRRGRGQISLERQEIQDEILQ